VNDIYGHLIGDQLLVSIAKRFEKFPGRRTPSAVRRDEFLYSPRASLPGRSEKIAGGSSRHLRSRSSSTTCSRTAGQCRNRGVGLEEHQFERRNSFRTPTPRCTKRNDGPRPPVVFTPEIRREAVSRFALVRASPSCGVRDLKSLPTNHRSRNLRGRGLRSPHALAHPNAVGSRRRLHSNCRTERLILELGASPCTRRSRPPARGTPGRGTTLPYVTVNLSAHQFTIALIP